MASNNIKINGLYKTISTLNFKTTGVYTEAISAFVKVNGLYVKIYEKIVGGGTVSVGLADAFVGASPSACVKHSTGTGIVVYYIDTSSYSTATAIWTDEALTTKVSATYKNYSDGIKSRFWNGNTLGSASNC